MNIKDDAESQMAELYARLKEQRDEIRVQMHLAGMEAKEEWDELEEKWHKFAERAKHAADEAEPAAEEIGSALSLLGEEIHAGYRRIREAMKD